MFGRTYSNLTSIFFAQKIVNYFNDKCERKTR